MGPRIANVFPSMNNNLQHYTSYLFLWNALHVSGGPSAHHQEPKNCVYSIGYFFKTLLLPAVVLEEMELTVAGSSGGLTKYSWGFWGMLVKIKLLDLRDNTTVSRLTTVVEFDFRESAHRKRISKYNQQPATLHKLFISVKCSTCFRRSLRPSSGAQKLCIQHRALCQTFTATLRCLGRDGTDSGR